MPECRLEPFVARSHRFSDDGTSAQLTSTKGWTCVVTAERAREILAGEQVEQETIGTTIVGWRVDGRWVMRKSDEDLEREREEYRRAWDDERRADLEKHRAEWVRRTHELPAWIRCRIHELHRRGGEHFELDGWGYELVVAELAVLYDLSELEDSRAVNNYADREGTSGNQHAVARALAARHQEGYDLTDTPSALTPITGEPFYEKS